MSIPTSTSHISFLWAAESRAQCWCIQVALDAPDFHVDEAGAREAFITSLTKNFAEVVVDFCEPNIFEEHHL